MREVMKIGSKEVERIWEMLGQRNKYDQNV